MAAATTGLFWPLLSFPFLTFLLDHSPVYLLGFSPGPLNRFVLLLSWLVVLALARLAGAEQELNKATGEEKKTEKKLQTFFHTKRQELREKNH